MFRKEGSYKMKKSKKKFDIEKELIKFLYSSKDSITIDKAIKQAKKKYRIA